MSTNTLATYQNGEIIDSSHSNEITLALKGEFVGRNVNGIPAPGQSLGTPALPWGTSYINSLILDGQSVDPSVITSALNRVASGATRPFSSAPDFLRASGTALEFQILGGDVDLVVAINGQSASVIEDVTRTGVTPAPNNDNTTQINNPDIINDLTAGESTTVIRSLSLNNSLTEVIARVGQLCAFRTPTGEIIEGFLESDEKLVNVFRGNYIDENGNAITRQALSNNDTLTLMSLGFVFLEDNGTTVDISYRTPTISFNAPNSPQTGDYWFDISAQTWRRYSGTQFEVINRIFIGKIVSDEVATIAVRSQDFSNAFRGDNTLQLGLRSNEIVETLSPKNFISVYGRLLTFDFDSVSWNITTDLESGQVESTDTTYFLYLSQDGQTVMSTTHPHQRDDLQGFYHPYESWRCVGSVFNNDSDDLVDVKDVEPLFRGEYRVDHGGIVVEGTTTDPTKPTNLVRDNYYSQVMQKDLVKYLYVYRTNTTNVGGTAGSGDYLYNLPPGHKFDASKVEFHTANVGSTTGNDLYWRTRGTLSVHIDAIDSVIEGGIIPYDETRFRVFMRVVNANLFINSGSYQLSRINTGYRFEFEVPTIIGE